MKRTPWWVGRLGWVGGLAIGMALVIGGVPAASMKSQPLPEIAYSGDEGPGFWGEQPGWEACAGGGGRQSPIDINHVKIDPRLKPLDLSLHKTPIALINNGHTIEAEYEQGSTLTFKG